MINVSTGTPHSFVNAEPHLIGLDYFYPLGSHHEVTVEDVGVVLVDELLHSLLPHLKHLGASVVQQGELLQHDVFGRPDLCSKVELGCLWLRVIL